MAKSKYTTPLLYQPFNHTPYQEDLVIKQTVRGQCIQQAKTNIRKDAWHCIVGKQQLDPCFQHPFVNKHELICPTSPWSSHAIKVITEQKLDNRSHIELDMSTTEPWAIELTDGTRCINLPSKKKYRYRCQNNQYIIGNLYRCKEKWQVYRKQAKEVELTEIQRAWF